MRYPSGGGGLEVPPSGSAVTVVTPAEATLAKLTSIGLGWPVSVSSGWTATSVPAGVVPGIGSDTASALGKALMSREQEAAGKAAFEKDYLAVCRGWPDEDFIVDHPLDGGPGKPVKKPAITAFERLATCELATPSAGFDTSRYALLRARPHTGRFRQIRRHLKHVSHHLIGDTSHGDGRHNRAFRMLGIHRMLLHAQRLAFGHPHDGSRVDVVAPVDAEFEWALALFEGQLPQK